MQKLTKEERKVVKHAKAILAELGIDFKASKECHFNRGLNEDICDAIDTLIDKKSQFTILDDYSIVVIKFQKPSIKNLRIGKRLKSLVQDLWILANSPEMFSEYEDCKALTMVKERIKFF